MISQTSEDFVTIAPASAARTPKRSWRPRKLNGRTFDFLWWRDSRRKNASKKQGCQRKKEELTEVKIVESKARNNLGSRTSFEFFKNIKRHMQVKKLTHKSKRRKDVCFLQTKEVEASGIQNETNYDLTIQKNASTVPRDNNMLESNYKTDRNCDDQYSNEILALDVSQSKYISERLNRTLNNCNDIEEKLDIIDTQIINKLNTDANQENVSNICQSSSDNESGSRSTIENVVKHQIERTNENTEINRSNDNKIKASLTEELLKLSNYGWYWGPISGNEADAKLLSEPDGAFLVRDSSDDRYVLTLSFKSSGKLLHARMEHTGGLFSLCNQSESEGFSSVADLINYSMNFSQSGVFCYSRPKYPGHPSFPVRLTKPVSRFTQVRSLQYLCRFVIRQYTRLDNIHKLPLPKTIKGYIEEAHY
ncbi:uncharacterized protein LOC122534392 isoform X1 [Frieseomelitta varia]|uniref:uncharacterized protein LOC122534392 isoform X1 n=1 Tax=Frieseomelitta varia TaxID=561572 RepID=UPI001CB6B383|nr:uncharacterized protein LOC122534392 isoform X1 [Frieseomelitta varia]